MICWYSRIFVCHFAMFLYALCPFYFFVLQLMPFLLNGYFPVYQFNSLVSFVISFWVIFLVVTLGIRINILVYSNPVWISVSLTINIKDFVTVVPFNFCWCCYWHRYCHLYIVFPSTYIYNYCCIQLYR